MKISLDWMREFVEVNAGADQLERGMTMGGIEVEGVLKRGADFKNVVVAEVISYQQHPNADRLRVCRVNDGNETRQIVCGAKNFKEGDRVPLALPGAVLPGDFKIKESKLRGELSQGMMCSAKELELATDAEGLLLLDPATPVGTPIGEVFKPDTIFDLEITPNRPDLLSVRGMAREWAFLGLGALKPVAEAPSAQVAAGGFPVTVDNPADCPYYSATVLEGVKVGPSPAWLAARLESVGLRPINNVADITNFVLLEMGQPMHAFDADKLEGGIRVRHARAGEKILALDHKEYPLDRSELVIADARGPVALAGAIGGEASAVTESTVRVVLEVARFQPSRVRAAARQLGISTDSSYRFERGIDPALATKARDRALQLLADLCGARPVAAGVCGEASATPLKVSIRPARASALLGIPVTPEGVRAALEKCGCRHAGGGPEQVEFEIPSWRGDLVREADLIEEIIRVESLDKVPSRYLAEPAAESAEDRKHRRVLELKKRLAALGFFEVVTVPFEQESGGVAVANPMTADQKYLRDTLCPRLLRAVADNINQGNKSLRLFEVGKVYGPQGEHWSLACAVSGPAEDPHWAGGSRDLDLFDLKGVLELLHLPSGCVRAVPRSELKDLGVKQPVSIAEITLSPETLSATENSSARFAPWPLFPAVGRDMALVVPASTPAGDVLARISKLKPPMAESVALFDVYRDESGQKLAADRKSLAFAVRYRNPERTLTDDEVNRMHDGLKAALKTELGCEFRE